MSRKNNTNTKAYLSGHFWGDLIASRDWPSETIEVMKFVANFHRIGTKKWRDWLCGFESGKKHFKIKKQEYESQWSQYQGNEMNVVEIKKQKSVIDLDLAKK